MDQKSWLDRAVSGIRFGPDRRAVRAELEEHLEDKILDLQRIFPDIPEEEVRDRALAGMGDAEELKVSLAKIHRPWLGYLWAVSQLLLIPVILSALVIPLFLLIEMTDWEARDVILGARETAWSAERASRSISMVRDTKLVQVDDCLLTMGRVWLVEPETAEADYTLQVELRLLSPLIWVENHYFFTKISAADSDGNEYAAAETWDWSNRPEHWVSGGNSPRSQSILPRLFQERYLITLGGVDPDVEWVQLEYDWMGRSFSMRAEREET